MAKSRPSENAVLLTVSVGPDIRHFVDDYARREDLSVSQVVRKAIRILIDSEQRGEEPVDG